MKILHLIALATTSPVLSSTLPFQKISRSEEPFNRIKISRNENTHFIHLTNKLSIIFTS